MKDNIFSKNRKAQFVAEPAVLIFSIIAIIIILLVFYLIISFKDIDPKEYEVTSKISKDIEIDVMLNNILNTPVIVDGSLVAIYDYLDYTSVICKDDEDKCKIHLKSLDDELSDILKLAENKKEKIYDHDSSENKDVMQVYRIDIYESDDIDDIRLSEPDKGGWISNDIKPTGYVISPSFQEFRIKQSDNCFDNQEDCPQAVSKLDLSDGSNLKIRLIMLEFLIDDR